MIISCSKIKSKKNSEAEKKTGSFEFAVYDSVTMINSDHWNKVVNFGSEFLKIPYLTVMENENPQNMSFHYAIIYQTKIPIAIAYFQVVDFSSENFGSFLEPDKDQSVCAITAYLKKHITSHLKRRANNLNMRLLICGNSFISGEHGFSCVAGVDKKMAFDALADVTFRISRAEKLRGKIAAILVKDFYSGNRQGADELSEFKYHNFLVEPNMILDIHWKTFEEYQNAMSKKYRNRSKSINKKGNELERKSFEPADILKNEKRILELYNNVHLKAKFRMASLNVSYFVELKKALGVNFSFVAYYNEEELIGFRTSFKLNKAIEAHFIGLDYDVNNDLDLYQNILCDYVKDAIVTNSSQLFLGRTASEIKSTVGAEAHELVCYIRHRNPISNQIIKPFLDYLKPTEWIPRNPFKENSI